MIPFVSITDFMDQLQVRRMLQVFSELKFFGPRNLGIGIMTSFAVINNLETRYSSAFPKPNKFASIFLDSPHAFNVIHYVDYHQVGGTNLEENLRRLARLGGKNLHAIQLDMIWPSPTEIGMFRATHPKIQIIVQIGRQALELVDRQPARLVEKVLGYQSQALDAVLVDMSMGEGLPMNWQKLLPYLQALREARPSLGLIVGGGL